MVHVTFNLTKISVSVGGWPGGITVGRTIAAVVLSVVVALFLLTAGIALIRRHKAAILHIPAGVLGLVALLFTVQTVLAVLGTTSAMRKLAWAQQQPANGDGLFTAALAITVLIQGAYPGFLIVWFLRPAIRRQVLSWEPPPREKPAGAVPLDTPGTEAVESVVPPREAPEPPVRPRDIPEPPPASWPKVIGICSIAVASLSALAWVLPDAGEYLGRTACMDVPLALALAGAGICLLLHRPAAMGHVAYAVFRLLWCAWVIAGGQLSGPTILRVGVDAAYAVFLLAWFARKTTRLRIEYWAQSRAGAPRPST